MNSSNRNLIIAQRSFVTYLEKVGKAHATILAYGKDTKQLVAFLAAKKISQVTSITNEMLEEFKQSLADQGYSSKTVSRKLNSIKTFFRYLEKIKAIKKNPAAAVSHPKYTNKPPRILSKIEYRALRDAAREDVRVAALIEILLQTGMRIGELSRLQLEDFKEKEVHIRPYESHQGRTMPLNNAARQALDRYLNHRPQTKSQNIFVTKTGRPLLVRNIRASVNRYFKLANVKNTKVNDLRHTFVVYQLTNGVSVVLLQKLIGHKRISTTEKYLELVRNKEEKTIKLEEL